MQVHDCTLTIVSGCLHDSDQSSDINSIALCLQVVECLSGYKIKVWGLVLVTVLTVCSGGSFWIFAQTFSTEGDVDDERKFTAGCTVCAGKGTTTGSYQAYITILPLVLALLKAFIVCASSSISAT